MPGAFTSPYAPRELYDYGPSRTLADLARLRYEQQADALRQQGQISGQLWAGVGQSVGQTLGQLAQYKLEEPRRQLQAAQASAAQLDLAQRQHEAAGRGVMRQAMAGLPVQGPTGPSGGDLPPVSFMKQDGDVSVWDTDKLSAYMASQGYGDLNPTILKDIEGINQSHRAEAAARASAQQASLNTVARVAASARGLIAKGLPPAEAVRLASTSLVANKSVPPDQLQQVSEAIAAHPEQADAILAHFEGLSNLPPVKLGKDEQLRSPLDLTQVVASNVVPEKPTEASLAATANDPMKTPQERDAARNALTALQGPTVSAREETARHNREMERIANLTQGREAARDAEMRRHHQALESQAEADASALELSPEGLDAAAMNFAKTGQLPAMGMGRKSAGVRAQIINRAAQLVPGLDIASNRAEFSANQASLTQLQKQRDAIGAFEQTAMKNIDVFLTQAGKVVDTGSPLANSLARTVSGKMLGSPDQAAYDAARQVAINEIAKITSNPNLSGTLSDSARHEIEAFNPQNATLKQTVAVMRLLKRDMENRTISLDEQLRAIRGRIGRGGPRGEEGSDPLGLFGGPQR